MICELKCPTFLQNGFQRLRRNNLIIDSYLFLRDLICGLLYFALTPLHFLFFKFPKVYEVIISVIIFIKNNIPTIQELKLTINVWLLNILLGFIYIKILIAKTSIFFITITLEKIDKLLDNIDFLKYKN